jgi:hypothetical protein
VARALWQTPALRAELVANATSAAGQPAPPPAAGRADQGLEERLKGTAKALQDFENERIPFGWDVPETAAYSAFGAWTVPGWLITAGAVALGAPFWFGLLQSLVNIRNAGPKPKRSDDPSAKDS